MKLGAYASVTLVALINIIMEDISLFFSLKVIKLWEKQKQLYLVGSNGVVVDPLSIAVTSPHATSAYCTDKGDFEEPLTHLVRKN